jgi:hypothetical protein
MTRLTDKDFCWNLEVYPDYVIFLNTRIPRPRTIPSGTWVAWWRRFEDKAFGKEDDRLYL